MLSNAENAPIQGTVNFGTKDLIPSGFSSAFSRQPNKHEEFENQLKHQLPKIPYSQDLEQQEPAHKLDHQNQKKLQNAIKKKARKSRYIKKNTLPKRRRVKSKAKQKQYKSPENQGEKNQDLAPQTWFIFACVSSHT